MELINRQDAIKALKDTFLGDTYEIDVVACGAIECLKIIEAISIEWIKEYIRTHPASTDIYFKWMIDEWKAEQENYQSEEGSKVQ